MMKTLAMEVRSIKASQATQTETIQKQFDESFKRMENLKKNMDHLETKFALMDIAEDEDIDIDID